jgi:hypothetical protein
MTDDVKPTAIEEEPPTGSVVAIGWGSQHQEVWVSNRANLGNWYSPDLPYFQNAHPTWADVRRRAEGCTMALLVPGDPDAYAAGFDAGVQRVGGAVERVVDELRVYANDRHPDAR